MTARIRLEIQFADRTDVRQVCPPAAGDRYGIASGECPGCKTMPFYVAGAKLRRNPNRSHDEYMSDGYCVGCGDPVGYMYARVDTLFGIEEDQAVLNGRARVYG